MAVYKVPQDVEAEDKLIGPLTLKQFIFAIAAFISGYLMFMLATKVSPALIIIPMPFFIGFGAMALPIKKDQPMEVYLLAKLRFFFKPRRRLWSQDGPLETVKVTAPPKPMRQLTDGLTQSQVRRSLSGLANVMDTRGWSSKNSALQAQYQGQGYPVIEQSDRLVSANQIPYQSQPVEVHDSDDIYDLNNSAVAQHFNALQASAYGQVATPTNQAPIYPTPRVEQ